MADIPGDRRNDGLDWKDYVDSLFAKVQRDVDVARETVPKGIPWQDHVLLKIADESRLRDEMVLRLTERANAQDHLAEVVTSNAAKNVDTANTAAEKAIARTEAYARETIQRVEQVATLQDKQASEKIEALTLQVSRFVGAGQGRERASDRSGVVIGLIVTGVVGALGFLAAVAAIITAILLHKP